MFDIFISYAHSDNEHSWVDNFADSVSKVFKRLSGDSPKIFKDSEEISTAQLWEERIKGALEHSKVMISVVSPSYAKSEWCKREWEAFERKERQLRDEELINPEQGIIYPILLYSLDRGRFNSEQLSLVERINKRQWIDVSSDIEKTPLRLDQIHKLVELILDDTLLIEEKSRQKLSQRNNESDRFYTIITDPDTGLEWRGETTDSELSFDEALQFVSRLDTDDDYGWRLPSEHELESLRGEFTLDENNHPIYSLKPPFNSQRYGYLMSGDLVKGNAGYYIMNVRNGHIFNGIGFKAYVRAVRNKDWKDHPRF